MAKVTDFEIPPELSIEASRVISASTNAQGIYTNASVRRGARIASKRKRRGNPLSAFLPAAEFICRRRSPDKSLKALAREIVAMAQELRLGNFDNRYWSACPIISSDFFQSIPSSIPDPNPPAYAYRDQNNLPTVPTYPNGAPFTAPAAYAGRTSGGYFYDLELIFERQIYDLLYSSDDSAPFFLFFSMNGSLIISASHRGSKPMLSLLIAAATCQNNGALLSSTTPPTSSLTSSGFDVVRKPKSVYWRYRLPPSSPPYYGQVELRQVVLELPRITSRKKTDKREQLVCMLSPRPMKGRGFNNNTEVITSLSSSVKIYRLTPNYSAHGTWILRTRAAETDVVRSERLGSRFFIFSSTFMPVNPLASSFEFKNQITILVAGGSIPYSTYHVIKHSPINYSAHGYFPYGAVDYNDSTGICTFPCVSIDFAGNPEQTLVEYVYYDCTWNKRDGLSMVETRRAYFNLIRTDGTDSRVPRPSSSNYPA